MTTQRALLGLLSLLVFTVRTCQSVCVDPHAHAENNTVETEAVLGKALKLVCISCLKREEIEAETKVKWYYITDKNQPYKLIFLYDKKPRKMEGRWEDRLEWNGSKDLQDVSISITNVTMNDTGTYMCVVERTFTFHLYTPTFSSKMAHKLVVRPKASLDYTALYSEIMMYVLLVFLTLWLLVEMIYCYRKISKSDEQAQDSATDYLAIPSENKENPGPAVTE